MMSFPKLLVFVCMFLLMVQWGLTTPHFPQWKSSTATRIQFTFSDLALPIALSELINTHAETPQKIQLHSAISGELKESSFYATTPKIAFQWLLLEHSLAMIPQNETWLVLPQELVWKHRIYQKKILSPIALHRILNELAQIGKIHIHFNHEWSTNTLVTQSIRSQTIENTLSSLAEITEATSHYDASNHVLYFLPNTQLTTESLMLKHTTQFQAQQFLQSFQNELFSAYPLQVHYPTNTLVVLQGLAEDVTKASHLLQTFDQSNQNTDVTLETVHFETLVIPVPYLELVKQQISSSLQTTPTLHQQVQIRWDDNPAVQANNILVLQGTEPAIAFITKMIHSLQQAYTEQSTIASWHYELVPLKYLTVDERTIRQEGRIKTIAGVQNQLETMLRSEETSNDTSSSAPLLSITSDVLNNALLLHGSQETITKAKQLLTLWDQPYPQIRIEAFIFETTETYAREIGNELEARGIAAGAEAPNTTSGGPFTASMIGGPLGTTKAFQINSLLTFFENEGKGKVLARPNILTTNNLEAEIHSGSIINIKLSSEKNTSLKQIQTGVTLRVTPRLLMDKEEMRIWLHLYVETSTPLLDVQTDGIPQVNSQQVHTQATLQDQETLFLGGLIKTQHSSLESGIPFLKDLPLLGVLFSTQNKRKEFNHILVFVTPSLIEQAMDSSPTVENLLPDFSSSSNDK